MEKPSLPSGTRDFSPAVMQGRKYIVSVMERVFVSHGFGAMETPALENLQTLQGKYGDEGDQLLFKVLNSGDFLSKVDEKTIQEKDSKKLALQIADRGLRYDLTVPLARFVVMNRDKITFPFKRYQIQPVWRADRPQRGRYREFWQCDIDVVGTQSVISESELIEMVQEVFLRLDLGVRIRINHRGVLDSFLPILGSVENWNSFMIVIDKADKIGKEGVIRELEARGLGMAVSAWNWLWDSKSTTGNEAKIALAESAELIQGSALQKALTDTKQILNLLGSTANVVLDFTLARGLSYYTGMVFEIELNDGRLPEDFRLGSLGGGGRYDNLTEIFGLRDVSGVGVSFGLDRVFDSLEAGTLFPVFGFNQQSVLVCAMDDSCLQFAVNTARALRAAGLHCELYPGTPKLKKQLDYANSKSLGYAAIIGNVERDAQRVSFKNLHAGTQQLLSIAEIIQVLTLPK